MREGGTSGPSRTPVRWVNATGLAGVIEPDVSLQQARWLAVAIACSCMQQGFIAQESRLASTGTIPVIVRTTTAMRNVRMTIANLCTTAAIPEIEGRD